MEIGKKGKKEAESAGSGRVGEPSAHSNGVVWVEFEAYPEMAVAQLQAIAAEMYARWPLRKVALVHRLGRLPLGEVVVAVGVSAGHRAEAFEACRYGIDALKRDVPIWKREHFEGGEVWVTNHP